MCNFRTPRSGRAKRQLSGPADAPNDRLEALRGCSSAQTSERAGCADQAWRIRLTDPVTRSPALLRCVLTCNCKPPRPTSPQALCVLGIGLAMQRFVLRQNISRFRDLLAQEESERSRTTLLTLLATAERDLAILEAGESGARTVGAVTGPADRQAGRAKHFVRLFEQSPENYLLIDPGPGLRIVDLNDAFARTTMTSRAAIEGERLFDVFPDNPEDPLATGVSNAFQALRVVADTRKPHAMAIQRYDVRDSDGRFVVRHWRSLNSPLFSASGELIYILHRVEDVTAEVAANSGAG